MLIFLSSIVVILLSIVIGKILSENSVQNHLICLHKGETVRSTGECPVPLCPQRNNSNGSCNTTDTKICYAYTVSRTNQTFYAP
jgi:hypothetical protein